MELFAKAWIASVPLRKRDQLLGALEVGSVSALDAETMTTLDAVGEAVATANRAAANERELASLAVAWKWPRAR